MNYFIVMVFAFFGGTARFAIGESLPKINGFPIATLLINFLGCFCLALFVENYLVAKKVSQKLLLGIGTGFIGSFTTFSSCMLELSNLYLKGYFIMAFLYLLLSLFGGLFFVFCGMKVGQRFLLAQGDSR